MPRRAGVVYQKRFPMPGTTFAPNASAQGANNGVSWYSYNYVRALACLAPPPLTLRHAGGPSVLVMRPLC